MQSPTVCVAEAHKGMVAWQGWTGRVVNLGLKRFHSQLSVPPAARPALELLGHSAHLGSEGSQATLQLS
jgi:hypothetical protein